MSLTQAIKEAYADPEDDDTIIDTLELDHASFDDPIRIVANSETDMTLALEPGAGSALFTACAVAMQLQGYDDDGPTTGRLQIDNLNLRLLDYLRDAVQAGSPIKVKYRGYTTADLSQPGEVRGGLFIPTVTLTATAAIATLEPATKADRQAFPRRTYDLEYYHALHSF